jgi:hypothetical protein
MNTASRLISPRATRSKRSINSMWCGAGSYPQYRHHSTRLRRMRRRFSSSSAAMAGEISDAPNSGSVADRSCAKLRFAILRRFENVIPVLVEFLVGCSSGPAGSGFSLSVLQEFDDGALCSDVAFHGACHQDASTSDDGIRDRPISPRSPWQNPYVERLIGTVRRECLDHVLIFGERHLRRILALYSSYYNQTRTHLALRKDAPLRRSVQRSGTIMVTPILSGLHHRYARI